MDVSSWAWGGAGRGETEGFCGAGGEVESGGGEVLVEETASNGLGAWGERECAAGLR